MENNNLAKIKNLYANKNEKRTIFDKLKEKKISSIVLKKNIISKNEKLTITFYTTEWLERRYNLIINTKNSPCFNIEIFFHSIDYLVRLPVGAFSKFNCSEIKQLDIPLKTEHFFLLKNLRIKRFEVFWNKITKLSEVIFINGTVNYDRIGALSFSNGKSIKGLQTISILIATNKDTLSADEQWKSGLEIFLNGRMIVPAK